MAVVTGGAEEIPGVFSLRQLGLGRMSKHLSSL